jgi:hypothetical protein
MVGLSLSYGYDFPSGPAVVCTFGLALVFAATVRYVMRAERRPLAFAKVAATAVVIAGALWLSSYTAGRDVARAERDADVAAAAARAADEASTTVRDRVVRALEALEAAPDAPPADAVETLLSQGESLHRMMSSGEVSVSEVAVEALSNTPDEPGLGDLLNEVAFHAADPWVRLRGAQAVVARRDPLGLEALLDLLATQPPLLLQMEAIQSLRTATGQNFGYEPGGDSAANEEALQQWRIWWRANALQPFVAGSG